MKNKFAFALLISCSSMLLVTCGKNSNTCHWAAEPPDFIFQINHNGKIIPDSILNEIKISYYQNGIKKYIPDLGTATDTNYINRGLMGSREIGTFENQTFFLEYSNGFAIDTLIVNNLLPTPATNCQYKVKQIRFDNQTPLIDTSFKFSWPVYIFIKP